MFTNAVFLKPLAALTADDIRDLVDVRQVREHLHLDYKQELVLDTRDVRTEFLRDVTSFANAQGGYIVIGASEDRGANDGTPKEALGMEQADKLARDLTNLCRDGIDEPIAGLQIRDIELGEGRGCVVAYVPNSLRKPHMVNLSNHQSFHIRTGREKRRLSMQEVRMMVTETLSYRQQLVRYLQARQEALLDTMESEPFVAFMATPIYVDTEKLDPVTNQGIRQILGQRTKRFSPHCESIRRTGDFRIRLFGVEATLGDDRPEDRLHWAMRLFRTGHLEFCWQIYYSPNQEFATKPLAAYCCTDYLLQFLELARAVYAEAEINEPIAVTAFWGNVAGTYLQIGSSGGMPIRVGYIWRDPTIEYSLTVPVLDGAEAIARQIMDRLFNAYGHERCVYFDDANEFNRTF